MQTGPLILITGCGKQTVASLSPVFGGILWEDGNACRRKFSPDPPGNTTKLTTHLPFAEAQGMAAVSPAGNPCRLFTHSLTHYSKNIPEHPGRALNVHKGTKDRTLCPHGADSLVGTQTKSKTTPRMYGMFRGDKWCQLKQRREAGH